MGYTTEFIGKLTFDKPLTTDQIETINEFSEQRHEKDDACLDVMILQRKNDPTELWHHHPIWCQWVITDDGKHLMWDGGEKFYDYQYWLKYLINKYFVSWGRKLNGTLTYIGECKTQMGLIEVDDNHIILKQAEVTFKKDKLIC